MKLEISVYHALLTSFSVQLKSNAYNVILNVNSVVVQVLLAQSAQSPLF